MYMRILKNKHCQCNFINFCIRTRNYFMKAQNVIKEFLYYSDPISCLGLLAKKEL